MLLHTDKMSNATPPGLSGQDSPPQCSLKLQVMALDGRPLAREEGEGCAQVVLGDLQHPRPVGEVAVEEPQRSGDE